MKTLLTFLFSLVIVAANAAVPYVVENNLVPEYWQKPVIFIVDGDSEAITNASGNGSLSWAGYLLTGWWTNAPVRYFTNAAYGGKKAYDSLTGDWTNSTLALLPANNSVTQAIVALQFGINDIAAGSNATQVTSYLSNMCVSARNKGAKVFLFQLRTSKNLRNNTTSPQELTRILVNREILRNSGVWYDWTMNQEMITQPDTAGLADGTSTGGPYNTTSPSTIDGIHYMPWVDIKTAWFFDWTIRNSGRNGFYIGPTTDWDWSRVANSAFLGRPGSPYDNVFYGSQTMRGGDYDQGISGLTLNSVDAGFGGGVKLTDGSTSAGLLHRSGVVSMRGMGDTSTSLQDVTAIQFLTANVLTTNLSLYGQVELRTNQNNTIPASASVGGASIFWNSNGTVYLVTSKPFSTTWGATNKLGGP